MQPTHMPLSLPLAAIEAFCQTQAIQRLALFGSGLRGDMHADSDIDLLVEYLPTARISYLDMAQQALTLSSIIGRPVDLRTPQELSRHFRAQVLSSAQVLYEKKS
jgi:uncharacterized protein